MVVGAGVNGGWERGNIPGKRRRLTEWPCDSRWEQRAACWVDLPARSRPSITIKAPLELGGMMLDLDRGWLWD